MHNRNSLPSRENKIVIDHGLMVQSEIKSREETNNSSK